MQILQICKRLGAQLTSDYAGKELIAVVILKGSILFAADIVRHIKLNMKIDFVRLSSYAGGTETSGTVRIIKDISFSITGKHVLVIEDILDTGHTLSFFTNFITQDR